MKRFASLGLIAALAVPRPCSRRNGSRCRTGRRSRAGRPRSGPNPGWSKTAHSSRVGDRSHLFYVGKVAKHEFRNFEFSAEVMTSPGANSGIYVHTKWQGPGWPAAGYELQVINSNPPAETMNGYIEHKMTGSIYAVRNTWVAPARRTTSGSTTASASSARPSRRSSTTSSSANTRNPPMPSAPTTRRDGCWVPEPSRCRRTTRAAS